MAKRSERKLSKASPQPTVGALEYLMDLASETAEACRVDIERVLGALAKSSPHRMLLQSTHDRLSAVVLTLSAERRAPSIDLSSVECITSRGRKILAGVVTTATLLAAGAQISGYSLRDLADSMTSSATAADECFTEVQIAVALSTGSEDLGYLELRQLVERAQLLTLARIREIEAENPNPTVVSNLDRVLLGYRQEIAQRPSYVRAQLADTLDRIKTLEDLLGLATDLKARIRIDSALNRAGPIDHLRALLDALNGLALDLG